MLDWLRLTSRFLGSLDRRTNFPRAKKNEAFLLSYLPAKKGGKRQNNALRVKARSDVNTQGRESDRAIYNA